MVWRDHNAVRLDLNYRSKTIKNSNIWRLNNTLLNNQQITQASLAWLQDRHQGKRTAAAEVEYQRLKTETELSRMLYLELAKNCLTAKVKVTEDNVAFTELTPVYVPRKSANSRKTVLLIWMVAGLILGCGYALVKANLEGKKNDD